MLLNPISLLISFVVMSILLPRIMTPESYGIYNVAMSFLQLFVLVALLGQDTSILRFIPQYKVQEQWGLLKGVLRKSILNSQITALVIIVICANMIYFLSPTLGPEKTRTYLLTLPFIAILSFTSIRETALRALGKVLYSYIPDSILRPLVLGLSALLLFLFNHQHVSAPSVMGLGLAAILCSSWIGGYWLYKSLPKETLTVQPQYDNRHWLKVSLPLFFISAMNVILKRTDLIMLDVMVGPETVAYYSVATRLSDLAAFGLIFINMVATPMISELYHKGKHQELQRMITLAARGIFVLTLIISATLIFGGKFLLGVSGSAYIIAYTPLIILLLGQAFSASIGSTGFIMSMTGHQNQAAIIVAVVAFINIILNALLIPHFGMNGAAIATAIATCLWNLLMLPIVLRKLKLNPTIL